MSTERSKIIERVREKAAELAANYSGSNLTHAKGYMNYEVCALLDEIDQLKTGLTPEALLELVEKAVGKVKLLEVQVADVVQTNQELAGARSEMVTVNAQLRATIEALLPHARSMEIRYKEQKDRVKTAQTVLHAQDLLAGELASGEFLDAVKEASLALEETIPFADQSPKGRDELRRIKKSDEAVVVGARNALRILREKLEGKP